MSITNQKPVVAVQMTSLPDRKKSLERAERALDEACQEGAGLVAFPENFSFISEEPTALMDHAETLDGPTVARIADWARDRKVWILAGSVHLKTEGDQRTNTSLLFSDQGKLVARYDKIHLFDVNLSGDREYRESKTIQPGNKPVCADTPFGKVGLTICYDLRFPELYRALAKQGAEILFIPSAFLAHTGRAHWDTLVRARAIENQCYVVAPGQCGTHYPRRESFGHTAIYGPWGERLAFVENEPGLAIAELDLEVLRKVRRDLPALEHRRL